MPLAILAALSVVVASQDFRGDEITSDAVLPILATEIGDQSLIESEAIEPPCNSLGIEEGLAEVVNLDFRVSKSKDWEVNLSKIFASPTGWIDPSRKKNFEFEGFVTYESGTTCSLAGQIRVTGDYMDHVGFSDGRLVSSLYVRLEQGNVAGLVRFKLFLPKTRNGDSEILAAEFFRQVGFISPRTALVETEVNGAQALRLIQEAPAKELLEFNQRREGPIIEGDGLFLDLAASTMPDLEPLIGVKVINDNWGRSSLEAQEISLDAALAFSRPIPLSGNTENISLSEFVVLSHVLGVEHGLGARNAVFYFNPITQLREPIYYDGFDGAFDMGSELWMSRTHQDLNVSDELVDLVKRRLREFDFHAWISSAVALGATVDESRQRRLRENFLNWEGSLVPSALGIEYSLRESQSFALVNGFLATRFDASNRKFYACSESSNGACVDIDEADGYASIFGGHELDTGELLTFLGGFGSESSTFSPERIGIYDLPLGLTGFATGRGFEANYDPSSHLLSLRLTDHDTRILLSGSPSPGLEISMSAQLEEKPETPTAITETRFERNLLTGCLTLYEFVADRTTVRAQGGFCEDSINILSSRGSFDLVQIDDAMADALDLDFSNTSIAQLFVSDAGNDCSDFSAGDYVVVLARLNNCADKAISVGEGATLTSKDVQVWGASIVLAGKDSSSTHVNNLQASQSEICVLTYRKKQEFGGAEVQVLDSFQCEGSLVSQLGSMIEAPTR